MTNKNDKRKKKRSDKTRARATKQAEAKKPAAEPRFRRVLSPEMLEFQQQAMPMVRDVARQSLEKGVDPAEMFAYVTEIEPGELKCIAIETRGAKMADWSILDEEERVILHRLLDVPLVEGMMRVFYNRGRDRCTAFVRVSAEDLVSSRGGAA